MSDKKQYVIGHGKPPQTTRFMPGQSGNPKGRPKGAKNLATLVDKTINERVMVTENGKRKSISKLEATVKQLVNKAASGDHKAMLQLLPLVQMVEWRTDADVIADTPIAAADQTVIQGICDRIRRAVAAPESQQEPTNENEIINDDTHHQT